MKKLNIKIIGIYTIVEVLFALGFKNIASIIYSNDISQIITNGSVEGYSADELSKILLLIANGSPFGILISFIMLLVLSIKYKFGTINSLIALIIGIIVNRFVLIKIIISPGQFISDSIFISAIIDLVVFIVVGIGIYVSIIFNKRKYMHNMN